MTLSGAASLDGKPHACIFLAFECSPKVAFEVLGELVSLGWAFKWATNFFPFQYNAVAVKPALLGLR